MLCYAWNKLDEKDRVAVTIDDRTELLDLFAKVLINATRMLLKRGIDKNYIVHTTELAGIKGKLSMSQTLRLNLKHKQRTVCTYDDMSANILSNQILVTTLLRLLHTTGLDIEHRKQIRNLMMLLSSIETVELNRSLFKMVKLNRNNRFYGFIMNVCELLFDNTLPSQEQGKFKFSDFTRDDNKMNKLFEEFVRNFYRIETKGRFSVGREIIRWRLTPDNKDDEQFLPRMETDVTLLSEEQKIIIDAKYYSQTMSTRYEANKIHSTNLYQLFSYLINQENGDQRTVNATGILLYPTIEATYDLHYRYGTHLVQIKTVDLNTNWQAISKRLKDIVQININA